MKNKYPMKSGSFLGLVIDYERLINLQASSIIGSNKIENTNVKPKTKVKTIGLNTNRRGVRHD